MKIELRTITPVHIGNGEGYSYGDAYIDNRILHRCEIDYSKDPGLVHKVRKFIGSPAEMQKILKRYGVDLYTVEIRGYINMRNPKIKIREHIKNGIMPYIPGSSLKGAIRSALYAYYLEKNRFNVKTPIGERDILELMRCGEKKYQIEKLGKEEEDRKLKSYGQRFEKLVFSYSSNTNRDIWRDAKYDIMKFVQVSDFNPVNYKMYVDVVKTYDKMENYTKPLGFGTYVETVEGIFDGEIKITPQIRDVAEKEELLRDKLDLLGLKVRDLDNLENATHKFIEHLKKATDFYYNLAIKYDVERLEYNDYPQRVIDTEFKIRIGFGVGTHYQTILLLLDNNTVKKILHDMNRIKRNLAKNWFRYPRVPYPKTYEVVEYSGKKVPLGWLEVRV